MATPFCLPAALGEMPFGALLIVVLAFVLTTGLHAMSRSGLDDRGRKLIGRYMLVGMAVLILVALVIWKLRGCDLVLAIVLA